MVDKAGNYSLVDLYFMFVAPLVFIYIVVLDFRFFRRMRKILSSKVKGEVCGFYQVHGLIRSGKNQFILPRNESIGRKAVKVTRKFYKYCVTVLFVFLLVAPILIYFVENIF